MNLYIRVLLVYLKGLFRARITSVLDFATLRFRVLPNDLDFNLHMNNGRYLTIMDLGRLDLVARSGLLKLMLKQKFMPVLGAAQMRYRLPLMPFQPYDLQTKVLCWDDKWVYMEQRFVSMGGTKSGAVAAIALVKGSFYDPAAKTTVPTARLLDTLGLAQQSPEFPAYLTDWIRSEESLRDATA